MRATVALCRALLGVASVLALLPSLCLGAGSADADDETSCISTTARIVLSSERTQSGDWIARVRLVHGDGDPGSWERWRVAAEHRVEACEGEGTRVLMEANVTIPRSALRNPPFGHGGRRGGAGAIGASSGGGGVLGGGGDADGGGSGSGSGDGGAPPPPEERIPEGYAAIPRLGSAYRYRDDWLVWADARAACEADGSHLVVPSSEEEYNVLAKMSSKHPWVGLFYDKERGRYVTVNDEPIEDLPYVRWGAGEPDKSGDCIFFQSLTKTLYDEPCGFVEVFVCETPLYGVYAEQPEPPALVTQL